MLGANEGWKYLKPDKKSDGVILATRVRTEGGDAAHIEHDGKSIHSVAIAWTGSGDLDVTLTGIADEGSPASSEANGAAQQTVLSYSADGNAPTWPVLVDMTLSPSEPDDDPLRKTHWIYHPDVPCAPGNSHLVRVQAKFKPVYTGAVPFERTLPLVVECVHGPEELATASV